MDPRARAHSTLSQFNNRPPKGLPPASRHMDPLTPRPTVPLPPTKSRKHSNPSVPRPIATNSRVKHTEQFHRDLHLAYVNNALERKALGKSDAFDDLVSQFNIKRVSGDMPSPAPQLRLWISALSHAVSRLERTHSALVEAIVGMPWTTMDSHFVKSYTSFIGMLVSARPEYLSLVLERIVQGLTYQTGMQILELGLPESSSKPLTRRVIYDRFHHLLQNLLALIPTLTSTLQLLLVRNFPHKRLALAAHVTYIRNVLRIAEYCPELADRILSTIVDRAIQIDVEVQIELEELEDQAADQESGDVFELDPFDTVVGQEESSEDDDDEVEDNDAFSDLSSDAGGFDDELEKPAEVETDFHQIKDMVGKLDTILTLVFDYFNRSHAIIDPVASRDSSPPSVTESPRIPLRPLSSTLAAVAKIIRRSQFHCLLSIFDRTIIRTFKSRYTQFLVFWYSSLDPEFGDLFQGMLIEKALLDESQPTVTRVAAASYLASFVSRAQFVDRQSTRSVVSVLCDFLSSILEGFEIASRTEGDVGATHCTMFYAISQALFLIFCFRWRDLLEEDMEDLDELGGGTTAPAKKWMHKLDVMQRVVSSELNPLKICSTNVVLQFARVAHATDFVYCYSIMEANKRTEYAPSPSKSGSSRHFFAPSTTSAELNTFFPFDPYKLPKSSPYIDGIYREWSSVAIADDEDDEDEDEEDTEETIGQGIDVVGRASSEESLTGGIGASLEGMSISPARPPFF